MMTETDVMSDLAIPPGEYLEEVLEDIGISQAELARRMGRPSQAINEIIHGEKAVTPETALQLEQVVGVPAHIWTGLESEYRLILAKQKQLHELEAEKELLPSYPYSDLCKLGLVENTRDKIKKVCELRRFFSVSSLLNIKTVKEFSPAFRQVEKESLSQESLAAWLRAGHLIAERTEVAAVDKAKLEASIPVLRQLTRTVEPEIVLNEIKTILANCGVALVFVPSFKKSYTTGATYWLKDKAVIMMSMRGAWSDIFWFSLFHEIAHILKHDKRVTFLENGKHDPRYVIQEQEADEFAQKTLIPADEYSRFKKSFDFSADAIASFAEQIGIFPGIVTGRLQNDKLLPYTINHQRVRYKWNV
jgi:HTH-type transcriptional regulator/antitoxin HigA